MAQPLLTSAIITILPAMAALWLLLRRYEAYFNDARVFFSLVVGFFTGLAAAFLENVLFRFDAPINVAALGVLTSFLLYIFGYALVESAFKTVVLGSGGYRNRKDTPYYGAALGLGFGAMVSLMFISFNVSTTGILEAGWGIDLVTVLGAMALFAAGATFTHGAAGAWIGQHCVEGQLWKGLLLGLFLQVPILVCLWVWTWHGTALTVAAVLAAPVYGVTLLWMTQTRLLDHIVPPEIRDALRRAKRREMREQARQE